MPLSLSIHLNCHSRLSDHQESSSSLFSLVVILVLLSSTKTRSAKRAFYRETSYGQLIFCLLSHRKWNFISLKALAHTIKADNYVALSRGEDGNHMCKAIVFKSPESFTVSIGMEECMRQEKAVECARRSRVNSHAESLSSSDASTEQHCYQGNLSLGVRSKE